MTLFGGVLPITGISFLMFCIFAVLFVGYALGRITIKGVSLGDAGVFVIALIFGVILGSVAALKRNRITDKIIMIITKFHDVFRISCSKIIQHFRICLLYSLNILFFSKIKREFKQIPPNIPIIIFATQIE